MQSGTEEYWTESGLLLMGKRYFQIIKPNGMFTSQGCLENGLDGLTSELSFHHCCHYA